MDKDGIQLMQDVQSGTGLYGIQRKKRYAWHIPSGKPYASGQWKQD